MERLLLLSSIVAVLGLPIRAARRPHPARALGRALLLLALFDVVYLLVVLFVTPRP